MSYNKRHDVGHMLVTKNAAANTSVVSSSANDATEINGLIIDRHPDGADLNDILTSCKVVVPYTVVYASSGQSATVTANIQHSATTASTAFTDYPQLGTTVAVSSVVDTNGTTAAATVNDVLEMNYDLSGANRYVRTQVTVDLSQTTVADTATFNSLWIFGGSEQPPAN